MKLLYIANAGVPTKRAHSYQTVKMCEAFARNGLDVELVLTPGIRVPAILRRLERVWEYYGVSQRFKISELPSLDVGWLDRYSAKHESRNLGHLYYLLQAISFSILATLYCLFKRADVYYTRLHFFAFLFGWLRFTHRRKIYYESHSYLPVVSRLVKRGRIDGLIVITNRLKELYLKEGIPGEKILVAADGVDLAMFNGSLSREGARDELRIPADKHIIGYIGHLYDWKGAHILARAMKHLPDSHVSYFVGGSGDDVVRFREFVESNDIRNAVVTGHVPPTAVPGYLAASDVLVLPNIEEGLSHYTSPLKLFEYMASKRPVVASDLPAIREVLNEENAVLVEPGDPEALAEGIRMVLQDGELSARVARNACEAVQQYSWQKRAEKVAEFITYSGG